MKKTIPWGITWFMALMLVFSVNSWGQGTIDIVQNGDFENWTNALPDNWMGSKTSIAAANVNEYTTSVQSGAKACQLIEESTSHKRFTTETFTILANTEYTVTFYARGKGEIRNAFYRDGAYSAYSAYTVLDSDVWTEIVYTFEYTAAVTDVEVIFSVRSTDAIRDHIQIDNVSITYQDMAGVVATPTFSPNGGSFFSDTDVTIATATENATIYYSTVGIDGPWTVYTAPVTVTETTTLYAYATAADLTDSNVATATYDFPTVVDVADVAALRAGATDGTFYRLTAEAILTYQQSFRNQKYIQDATAGIMIDDNGGVINTAYNLYDGITGIIGTISVFGNMVQFVPAVDPGAATSAANVVEPVVISLQEFNNNFMDYQSRLVTIENVSFDVVDGTMFANGTVYNITDGTLTASFRTTFFGVDYIDQPVPSGNWNITGLPNSRNDGDFMTARNLADFEAYVAPFVEIFQAIPDYFNVTAHTERGFAVDANNIYVASRNAGVFVKVHNRLTGAVTGDLVTTGITGGTFAVNDVEVTADGVILAANMAMGDAGVFKIYQMDAVADPVVLIEYPVTGGRFGDKFTVVGSMTDGSAVIYAANGSAAEVVKWTMVADGAGFVFGEPETISIAVTHGGTPVVAPKPDGSFYYTASGHGVSKLNADGTLIGAISTDIVASSSTAMKYLGTEGTDEFLAIYQNGPGNENVRVVRLINGDPTDAVIEFVTPSMFVNANGNGTGDVAFIPNLTKQTGNVDLYVMGTNNGVGGYTSQTLNITFPVYLPPVVEEFYTVTFSVVDEDGVAIPDAVITFDGVAYAAGVYVFEDLAAGDYAYTIVADGYDDTSGTVTVADADVTVPVTMIAEVIPVFTVTFVIEDELGVAITDAVVTLNGVANAAGNYVFADLLAGEYAYNIAADGYQIEDGTVTVVDADVTVNVTLLVDDIVALTAFFENFDSVTAPALPEGWSKIIDATNTTADIQTSTLSTQVSAPNHIRMLNGNDAEATMVLVGPKITHFDTNWLTFWGRNSSATQTADLAIGYMTNPDNAASFVGVDTVSLEGNVYDKFFVDFEGLLDTDEYFVAFKYLPLVNFRTIYIDDVTWEVAPTQPLLTATPEALDFGLTDVDGELSLSLTLQNQGVGTLTITDGDMVLGGADAALFSLPADLVYPIELELAESITFDVMFSPVSEGEKAATLTIAHNGANSPFDVALTGEGLGILPSFVEDFNNVETPVLPGGWSAIVESTNDNANVETTTLATPYSLPNHVRMQNSGDLEAVLMLVSPKVNNFEANWLTFWAKFSTSAQNDSIVIGYTPDRNDPAAFVAVEKIFVSGNEYTRFTFEFPETMLDTDEYHIVFKTDYTSTFRTFVIDDIAWEAQPTAGVLAVSPESFAWEGIFINETSPNQTFTAGNFGVADLVLDDGSITLTGTDAALFDLIISEDLVFPLTLAPNESFTFEANFSPVAEGAFSANISLVASGETHLVPLTGTSIDPTITPNFAFDFIGDFPPENWRRWVGELNDSTELALTESIWVHGRFGNQADLPELNSARVNIYGNTRNHWLVTPPINLGDGTTDYMLNFDMALTAWNNSNPSNFGPNQYAAVVISTDNGQTWVPANILQMWGPDDEISNTGEGVTIDLTGYTGIVKIGFYGESRTGGGDVDWFVTNVGVREIEYFTTTFNVKDIDNNVITDATVTLNGVTQTMAPYVFENLLFGSYDYSVSKPGYMPVEGNIQIVDANVVVDVVLVNAYTVDFAVTAGANPVVMANIDIFDDADDQVGALETDSNGAASILLPAGTYSYDVFAVGFDLLENQAFTIVDADLSLDVVLTGPDPMMLPFVENFNDTILPEDWIIVNQPDHQPENTWEVIASLGTSSIDGTPFAIINSDAAGSAAGTINSILYTPAIDATVVTGVLTLSFEHYYRHLGANAFGKVEVWNGSAWIELAEYTATEGSWADPALATFDITEHANAQLRVRFHYTDGGSWAWYWAVDNVEVKDLQEYTLTLNVNPEGWGTVTGAGTHLETSQVEVTATANAGFEFLNWTDVEGEVVSTEANNVITMPSEDLTLTANFVPGAADPLVMNTLMDKTGANIPTQIADGGVARGAALYMDRYVVVPSRFEGANVWVWDMLNPHLDAMALDMGEGIVEGGLFPVNYAQATEDHIYVSNMKTADSTQDAFPFKVYRWNDMDSEPEVVISYIAAGERYGDSFTVLGDPSNDGAIVAHMNSGGEGQRIFKKWNFENGVLLNPNNPDVIEIDAVGDFEFNLNSFGVMNPVEGENDLYLVSGNGMGIALVNMTGEVLAYIAPELVNNRAMDPQSFIVDGKRYLAYGVNFVDETEEGARYEILDLSFAANITDAMNHINNEAAFNNVKVASFALGSGSGAFFPAITDFNKDDQGEVVFMTYVTNRGFVVETTGALPATYTLTVEAEPAEGGTVSGSGEYYEGATVPVTATAATGYEFVNWTVGTDVVSTDEEFHYTMPAAATTLVANFDLIPITEVATLAELRDLPADGTFYRYTGDAVIVAMDGFRNRKFLQDATAAILIDDQPGTITPDYVLYDVITDVVGVLNVHNQMLQFQPRFDAEPATENTPVDPYDFTIDGLSPADQAKLVKLHNVTFTNLEEGQVFANGQNYTITDGENTMTVRTDFWNVDYIGEEIPVTPINLTGVVLQFNDNMQLVPRFEADFEEYIAPETFAVTFNVNMSTAAGFDPETDVVYMTGSMLGWAAPGDDPANQTMERVGDSWIWTNTLELEAGTYEYKYFLNAGFDGGEWGGGDNRSVTVAADMTVNDVWGIPETVFELTLVADPAEGGTVTGEGFYEEGTEVLLTAVAAEDYVFVDWRNADDEVVSTEAEFTYTMPAMAVTLTAHFDVQPSVGDFASLDINVFPNPARDNFKITANSTIRSIEIADLAGKVVYNDIINDTETSINNNFETGIYLVRILTDEGVFVRKLQVQK